MKVNRIQWDQLKVKWNMLQMKAAYIAAEREIITQAEKGNDLTGFDNTVIAFEPMSPEDFFNHEVDAFGNLKSYDLAADILKKAHEVRAKLDNAIQNDDYTKAQMLQNILDGLEKQYNDHKNE